MEKLAIHETRQQFLKVGASILDPAIPTQQARIAKLLAGRWKVPELYEAGQAEATVALIGRLTPVQQAHVLTRIDAVGSLTQNRQAAGALTEVVERLPYQQQVKVLSMRYVVANLAESGQAARTASMIGTLPLQDQARILAARSASETLTKFGEGEAVTSMRARIDAADRPAVPVKAQRRRRPASTPR